MDQLPEKNGTRKMHIKKIWADGISEYSSESPANENLNLKRLNLLIGPNNSGKSRFLRRLFSAPIKSISICPDPQFNYLISSLNDTINHMRDSTPRGRDNWQTLVDAHDGKCVKISELKEQLEHLCRLGFNALNENLSMTGESILFNKIRQANRRNSLNEEFNSLFEYSNKFGSFQRYYIPILRGMRPLEQGKDLYSDRTIKDYFSETKVETKNLITGFDLYDLLVRNLLGQPADRQRIREYEKILGDEFFFWRRSNAHP